MGELASSLVRRYRAALHRYLRTGGEDCLQEAYELGREALRTGLGVFDMARLHQAARTHSVFSASDPAASLRGIRAAESFKLEALSPFEIAHRGFRRTVEQLQRAKSALEVRNRQLAATNRRLTREIDERKHTEVALRATRDHAIRLAKEAGAMEENLRQLSAKVLVAQEQERLRISRELHDEIGQALLAVNAAVGVLKKHARDDTALQRKASLVHGLLEQSMGAVRQFARELRPPSIDDLGLADALDGYLKEFEQRTGIATALQVEMDGARLDSQQATALFRIAQESLTNVFKHARATHAKIRIFSVIGGLCMEVRDNGRAFRINPEADAKWKGRLGLLGMQERIRLVRGNFAIKAVPGKGTTVLVTVPTGVRQKGS